MMTTTMMRKRNYKFTFSSTEWRLRTLGRSGKWG